MAEKKLNTPEGREYHKIKGNIYYARTLSPDKTYGKYGVTIGNLSEATVEALKELKAPVRLDPTGVMGYNIKTTSKFPIKTVDSDANEWDANAFIGNGSVGILSFYLTVNQMNKKAMVVRPTNLKITKFIQWIPPEQEDELLGGEKVPVTYKVNLSKSKPVLTVEEDDDSPL